jgi:hypothetical protein
VQGRDVLVVGVLEKQPEVIVEQWAPLLGRKHPWDKVRTGGVTVTVGGQQDPAGQSILASFVRQPRCDAGTPANESERATIHFLQLLALLRLATEFQSKEMDTPAINISNSLAGNQDF